MKPKHWLRIFGLGALAILVVFIILRVLALGAALSFWAAVAVGGVVVVGVVWGLVSHIFKRR